MPAVCIPETVYMPKANMYRRLASALAVLLLMNVNPFTAEAQTTINVAAGDVPGLIAAVSAANAGSGPYVIELAPGSTYTLVAPMAGANNTNYTFGANGLYVNSDDLTIRGNGSTIERASTASNFRIILVEVGAGLTLDAITLRNGLSSPRPTGLGGGAGIMNNGGDVVLQRSTITANTSLQEGGGIKNYRGGSLVVVNSTISGNTAFGGRTGGGIQNETGNSGGPSTVLLESSTLMDNRADGNPGFQGRGDAVADFGSPAGSVTFRNSVLASPNTGAGNDCYGSSNAAFLSLGYNLDGDGTCGLTAAGDISSTDPLLGPLAENGGLTPTHLPLTGSPLIGAGDCFDSQGSPRGDDQNGVARDQDCEIGAAELPQTTILAPDQLISFPFAFDGPEDISIDGDRAAAGGYGEAKVFEYGPTGWYEVANIPRPSSPPSLVYDGSFGHAISLSGDRLAIGAYQSDVVLVYDLVGSQWTLTATILDPSPTGGGGLATGNWFGRTVALDGDDLIIGTAHSETVFAYHTSDGTTWAPAGTITGVPQFGGVGGTISLQDGVLTAGSYIYANEPAWPPDYVGSALTFVRSGPSTWSQASSVGTPEPLAQWDIFGWDVSASSTDMAVTSGKRVYMYENTGSPTSPNWSFIQTIDPPAIQNSAIVAISGGVLVVGGTNESAVPLYLKNQGTWELEAMLEIPPPFVGNIGGVSNRSLDVEGNRILLGAWDYMAAYTVDLPDSDGDGIADINDPFPNDPGESADADGDGLGDNADQDDSNNGIPDPIEDGFASLQSLLDGGSGNSGQLAKAAAYLQSATNANWTDASSLDITSTEILKVTWPVYYASKVLVKHIKKNGADSEAAEEVLQSLAAFEKNLALAAIANAEASCTTGKTCLKELAKSKDLLAIGDKNFALADTNPNKAFQAVNAYGAAAWWAARADSRNNSRLAVGGSFEASTGDLEVLPTETRLTGNYPNPFNPETSITFELAESAHVRLLVYDVTGRQVGALLDGSMQAGRHSARFNASTLPSGLYVYRLQAGEKAFVGRMLLVK